MPTYEYHCEKCGKNFDAYQSMKDDAFGTCPKELCRKKTWGKGKVKRLLGAGAGLIFKGSGFYITDYRSSGYKDAAKKDSSSGEPKVSESKASDSKPADIKKPAASTEKSKPKKAKE